MTIPNYYIRISILTRSWTIYTHVKGFPGGSDGKESPAMWDTWFKLRFDSWVGKIPWRRVWQPTLVFLPGESPCIKQPGGLQSMESQRVGHK